MLLEVMKQTFEAPPEKKIVGPRYDYKNTWTPPEDMIVGSLSSKENIIRRLDHQKKRKTN